MAPDSSFLVKRQGPLSNLYLKADPMRPPKALLMTIVAALVALPLALVPSYVTPAQALASFACYPPSTINPACQPANIPILVEAGVVGGGGGGSIATAATVGGSSGAAAVSGTATLAASAAFGILGTAALLDSIFGTGAQGKGFTRLDGIKGQVLKTDPSYVSTEPVSCTLRSPTAANFEGSDKTAAPMTAVQRVNTCIPGEPWLASYVDEYARAGSRTLLVSAASGVVTLALGPVVASACGTLCDFGVRRWCDSNTTNVRQIFDVINVSTMNWAAHTMTLSCSAGWTLVGVSFYSQSASGSLFSHAMLYNPANTSPREGGTITGQIRTTIKCRPNAGGPDITIVVPETSIDVAPGSDIPIPDALCPAGYTAVQTKVDFKKPSDVDFTPIVDTPTPDYMTELPQLYPLCFVEGASCTLTLWKTLPGGLESCGTNGELCDGWAQSPGARENYECYYGDYPVEIDKCSAFRYPQLGKLPNVKADGTPIPIEAPAPTSAGNPAINPGTGLPFPFPVPGSGAEETACFPSGWGIFNPVSWVYMPIQCALSWAFKPNPVNVTNMQLQLKSTIESSALGAKDQIIEAFVVPFELASGGCQGPPWHMTMDFSAFGGGGGMDEIYYPLSACGEPMAGFAQFVNVMGSFGIMLTALAASLRYFASIFGFVGFGALSASGGSSRVTFKDEGK